VFDLRWLIGGLFTAYGVLLTVVGLFASRAELAKAQGVHINLWVGLAMLALGLLFLLWRWRRPAGDPRQPATDPPQPATDPPQPASDEGASPRPERLQQHPES
jgi:hypothetical protein